MNEANGTAERCCARDACALDVGRVMNLTEPSAGYGACRERAPKVHKQISLAVEAQHVVQWEAEGSEAWRKAMTLRLMAGWLLYSRQGMQRPIRRSDHREGATPSSQNVPAAPALKRQPVTISRTGWEACGTFTPAV